MKYMLQIRSNGARAELEPLTTREQEAISTEYTDIGRLPGVLDRNELQRRPKPQRRCGYATARR